MAGRIASLALFVALLAVHGASAGERVRVLDVQGRAVPDAVVEWPRAVPGQWRTSGVVDQVGKRFVPFVSVVPVGTDVRFPNSDDTRHHVYSFSDAKTFELKLYHANDAPPVRFDRAGLVTLGCNVHDNMKAYLVVSEAPFAGASDAAGEVAGPATEGGVRVWHPQLPAPLELQAEPAAGGVRIVRLPQAIEPRDEQARPAASLEERLKRFKRDAT